MLNPIYTAEFKEEAIRQITERGYSVKDVSERLGVSTHSLYKWVKAVKPDRIEQRDDELLEAKREVLKLKAELRRVEEERDILKKAAGSSTGHCNTSSSLSAGVAKSSRRNYAVMAEENNRNRESRVDVEDDFRFT